MNNSREKYYFVLDTAHNTPRWGRMDYTESYVSFLLFLLFLGFNHHNEHKCDALRTI